MKKIFCYLVMIVLSACTLEENIKKEEGKDYQDVVHPVDMVDYEFEQRLNSFYESEPIQNEELYGLYKGEFPEDERNPTKLRIHWRDARELALAELELQRPMQAGWEEADISVRPILVLDRDGGDFYRYYEYRVVLEMRFLGAIRIPAYRRTENFATAEVHRYSDDEKTYTIHSNGWGNYIADNSILEAGSTFYSAMLSDIFSLLQNKNFAFNWYYRSFENQKLINNTSPVSEEKAYWLAYDKLHEMVRKVKIPSNTAIGDEHLDFMAAGMAQDNQKKLADTMTSTFRFYTTAQSIADITDKYDASYLSGVFMNSYNIIYKKSLNLILTNMSKSRNSNLVRASLKLIFWETLDSLITNNSELSENKYLKMSWNNLGNDLTKKDVYPKINYTDLDIFPSYKNNSNPALRYRYVTTKDFEKGQRIVLSFANRDESEKVDFDQECISMGQFEAELEQTDPKFDFETKTEEADSTETTKSVSHNDIDTTIQQVYDMLKTSFTDKSEQRLKSEIASVIYSQSDIQSVYYKEFNNSKNIRSVQKNTRNIVSIKEKTLPEFPDHSINDILDNLIDDLNIGATPYTMGIWFASGYVCKNMSDEMKALNDNMDELTKLYDFLANDYNNVLDQVYTDAFAENGGDAGAAKAARDKFQGQLKILESIVREGDVGKGVKRAMKLMVKKWLVWYFPLFFFPTGHWMTYSTGGDFGVGASLSDVEGYAKPISDGAMALAVADKWLDMEQLPVSKPSDQPENMFGQYVPDELDTDDYNKVWIEAYRWFQDQPLMQHSDMTPDHIRNALRVFENHMILILAEDKVHDDTYKFAGDLFNPPAEYYHVCQDDHYHDIAGAMGVPARHYHPNQLGSKYMMPCNDDCKEYPYHIYGWIDDPFGSSIQILAPLYTTNREDLLPTPVMGQVELHKHDPYTIENNMHRTIEDTRGFDKDLPNVPSVSLDLQKEEIYRFLNNEQFLSDAIVNSEEPKWGTYIKCINGDPRRCGGARHTDPVQITNNIFAETHFSRSGISDSMGHSILDFPETEFTPFEWKK